jgi:AcrR family transcriptional regulator
MARAGAARAQDSDGAEATRRGPGRPRHDGPSPAFLARQAEIIAKATTVFQKRGYEAATLDEVAEALGLRKASLYYYVGSKPGLLHLVFDRAISVALDRLGSLTKAGSPEERLEALIRHQVQMIVEDPNLFQVFFDHHAYLTDEAKAAIRKKEQRYLRLCSEVVEDAVAAGVIPPMDKRYGAQAILGITSWIYKWFDPKRDDPDAFADVVVSVFLRKRRRSR